MQELKWGHDRKEENLLINTGNKSKYYWATDSPMTDPFLGRLIAFYTLN